MDDLAARVAGETAGETRSGRTLRSSVDRTGASVFVAWHSCEAVGHRPLEGDVDAADGAIVGTQRRLVPRISNGTP